MDISFGGSADGAEFDGAFVRVTGGAVGDSGIAVSVEERVGVTAVSAGVVDVVVDSGVQAVMRIVMKISTIIRL